MKKLIEGIHQFQRNICQQDREKYAKLVQGQNPEALFITCSDSRVVPSIITQSEPGDLFIIRNVGNIVPAYGERNNSEAAAIEYAVGVLGVKDIIVCGHTHCGAMHFMLDASHEKMHNKEYEALHDWLRFAEGARRAVAKYYAGLTLEEQLEVCAELSVLAQIENLRSHPSVMLALTSGQLTLHAWVFDIECSQMNAFNPNTGQFEVLEDYEAIVGGDTGPTTAKSKHESAKAWTRS